MAVLNTLMLDIKSVVMFINKVHVLDKAHCQLSTKTQNSVRKRK